MDKDYKPHTKQINIHKRKTNRNNLQDQNAKQTGKIRTGGKEAMDKDYKPHTEQIIIHKRKTNKTEITNSYFQNILNVMAKKNPHKSLKQYVNNLSLPPCALGKEKYITSEKHSVDKVALALYPSDVPNQHTKRLPVLCCADGNCLSHCGEIFSASSHVEIRVRIIVESVLHESKYLDPSFLSVGIPENKTNLVTAYTMYSDFYKPGTLRPITENTSQYYFRKETLAITRITTFTTPHLWEYDRCLHWLVCCKPSFVLYTLSKVIQMCAMTFIALSCPERERATTLCIFCGHPQGKT